MPNFGAHMSISGGMHNAFGHIQAVNGQVLQVFTRNQRRWAHKPVTDEEVQAELEANKTEIEAQYNTDLPFKYQKGERVTFQRITLPFTVETKEQTIATGQDILNKLDGGETFEDLLTEHNPNSVNNGIF